jgi:phosphatidylinositol dimannoside acyltransferase
VTSRKGFEAPHRRLESTPPRIVEKAAVIGYRSMSAVLAHTPPAITRGFIGGANQLAYLAWPAKRHYSNVNMAHVLGLQPDDPRVRRLALRAYREYARYMVELMRLPSRPREELAQALEGEGLQPMIGAFRASGKSMIVVCGHIGNNEAVAAAIASQGLPANVVADDSSFPEIFEILREQRESWGVHVVPWRNIRELFTILRRNEMLALLVDWGYRADGIPVQLFGSWTTLPAGPAVLAAKTGALITFMAVRRQPSGRFRVETTEPLGVPSSNPADLQAATQRIAAHLEAALRAAPVQWYSFKQVWPDDPAEADELAARAAIMQSGRPDPGPGKMPARGEDARS